MKPSALFGLCLLTYAIITFSRGGVVDTKFIATVLISGFAGIIGLGHSLWEIWEEKKLNDLFRPFDKPKVPKPDVIDIEPIDSDEDIEDTKPIIIPIPVEPEVKPDKEPEMTTDLELEPTEETDLKCLNYLAKRVQSIGNEEADTIVKKLNDLFYDVHKTERAKAKV